jgi:hypothetical protein
LVENHLQLCWKFLGLDKQPIIRAVSLEVHLSRMDFTRRMAQASGIMGIAMVDHLVLGATGQWVSVQARGGW